MPTAAFRIPVIHILVSVAIGIDFATKVYKSTSSIGVLSMWIGGFVLTLVVIILDIDVDFNLFLIA